VDFGSMQLSIISLAAGAVAKHSRNIDTNEIEWLAFSSAPEEHCI
jgi:hypothetical protein